LHCTELWYAVADFECKGSKLKRNTSSLLSPKRASPCMESFVDVSFDSDFPLENLPWGVFEAPGQDGPKLHVGVALGQHAVSATALYDAGFLRDLPGVGENVFSHGRLNEFMSAGRPAWQAARSCLQRLLSRGEGALRDCVQLRERVLFRQSEVRMQLPAHIGDYTDFYASRQHATNVGAMFRGRDNALNPNWLHLPVGYHGRSSSIVPSGVPVRRPWGQVLPAGSSTPVFAPSAQVDFELEVAAVVGPGNPHGEPIPAPSAWSHVFGLVLLNDWSARDVQRWEYVPLGPFNGKNWATQISPWVVTLEALEPYRCSPPPRQQGQAGDEPPELLPYLREELPYTYDIELFVDITPAGAAEPHVTSSPSSPAEAAAAASLLGGKGGAGGGGAGGGGGGRCCCVHPPTTVTRSNLKHLYWTFPQMLAHHTAGGCPLRPGDLLASGTISGDTPDSRGCLLELTCGGKEEVVLMTSAPAASGTADGGGGTAAAGGVVRRRYLEDGDTVTLRGRCGGGGGEEGSGEGMVGRRRGLGFGVCSGTLLPARAL
ncbi:hypothetical protein Agub_g14000, partial [Astrephomene gubernaculifera]